MKLIVLMMAVLLSQVALAQEQPRFFEPVANQGQTLRGAIATNQGATGFGVKKVDGGFSVVLVTATGPAAKSGLQTGDLITMIDGKPVATLSLTDLSGLLSRKPGEILEITYSRIGQQNQIRVPVVPRGSLYADELKAPPAVSQFIVDDQASVQVSVSQLPSQPQSVVVWLLVSNPYAASLMLDDAKFFVLDGQGQQLRHMSLDEVKFSIQAWLAQNWRGRNYPPPTPPPAQHRYTITGSENGNYTFTEMGGTGIMSGTSSGTYTVQEQPDYSQAGYMPGYSLGLALRQRADRKHDDEIMKQAQQTLSQYDSNYFRSQSPIISGENRYGGIVYWSGSTRQTVGPFKVVLFLTNPATGKQEIVKFDFH